jgi:hypothetical protein
MQLRRLSRHWTRPQRSSRTSWSWRALSAGDNVALGLARRQSWAIAGQQQSSWLRRSFLRGRLLRYSSRGWASKTRQIWHLWVWQAGAGSPLIDGVPERMAHEPSSQTHWLRSLSKRARSSPWTSRSLCPSRIPASDSMSRGLLHIVAPPALVSTTWPEKRKDLVVNVVSEVLRSARRPLRFHWSLTRAGSLALWYW